MMSRGHQSCIESASNCFTIRIFEESTVFPIAVCNPFYSSFVIILCSLFDVGMMTLRKLS